MEIQKASAGQRNAIVELLQQNQLPFQDLPADTDDFFVATDDSKVIAVIGLEPYGECGLLRSMVVDPSYRDRQVAASLVEALETNAAAAGIRTIYLLTETAEAYFSRKGYQRITREEVPEALHRSSEFSHVCPQSAVVMKKEMEVKAEALQN